MKVPLILLGNIVEISLFVCQIQYQLSKLTNTHKNTHYQETTGLTIYLLFSIVEISMQENLIDPT